MLSLIENVIASKGFYQELLNPIDTWLDKEEYDETATKLVNMFIENFKQYDNFPEAVVKAGPIPQKSNRG